MNSVYILLGSNIDKEVNLPSAVRLLRQLCQVVSISPVYETAPVGLLEQPSFLNAAVLVETTLDWPSLRERVLAQIEQTLSRVRTSDKNAPRTIDLDVILFNDGVFEQDGRRIPDPDLRRFAHVAVPIADLAPALRHPESGETMRELARRLTKEMTAANDGRPPLWRRRDIDELLVEERSVTR